MDPGNATDNSVARTASQFATTHWSVVLSAADSASPDAREALEMLCRTYWNPLYAFVRMKGRSAEDAQDLTQSFFERFLEKHYVKDFAVEKGRFRTFLLTILQRFLCDQFDRSSAAKRGGGVRFVPLDTTDAEAQIDQAAGASRSPEATFDRVWADTLIQTSLERLRTQYEVEGNGALFKEIRVYLSRPADRASYSVTAGRLNTSADAVAMAVVRLRRRYRENVRACVANTVATPAEIDDELRYLISVLAG